MRPNSRNQSEVNKVLPVLPNFKTNLVNITEAQNDRLHFSKMSTFKGDKSVQQEIISTESLNNPETQSDLVNDKPVIQRKYFSKLNFERRQPSNIVKEESEKSTERCSMPDLGGVRSVNGLKVNTQNTT